MTMARRNTTTADVSDTSFVIEELARIVPCGAGGARLQARLLSVINRHLRPLENAQANDARNAAIIEKYCGMLSQRLPLRRPRTAPGMLRSIEAFVTRDIRLTAKEYADFETRAERTLMEHPAMHLCARGVTVHPVRARHLIDRFMLAIGELWEQLGSFRAKFHALETTYHDRNAWALHLHDRLNRLSNLITAIDAAVTSLKRSVMDGKSHDGPVNALHALRDNSLNPLEFIQAVFSGIGATRDIRTDMPAEPLFYSNHFIVREILLELMHNAVAGGAASIRIAASRRDGVTAVIEVVDDCPGGIDPAVHARIGKERIEGSCTPPRECDLYDRIPQRGWGLYTVFNRLVPCLGPAASISIESPLDRSGGTKITLIVPVIDKRSAAAPQHPSPTLRPQPHPAIIARLAGAAIAGGHALVSSCLNVRMPAMV